MIDRSKFKHTVQVTVRNNEIDWQGIVHNAVYLYYFEVGRMAYFDLIGYPVVAEPRGLDWKIVIARNEIDYRSAARFNETLDVFTRIAWIRNSSYALEGFIEDSKTKRLVAENVSFHVWLDSNTDKPVSVPQPFREKIRHLEGGDVLIQPTIPNA